MSNGVYWCAICGDTGCAEYPCDCDADTVDERGAPVVEEQLTEAQIRDRMATLAGRVGLTVAEVYERLDRGEYRGTIMEAKLNMLRFLLGLRT